MLYLFLNISSHGTRSSNLPPSELVGFTLTSYMQFLLRCWYGKASSFKLGFGRTDRGGYSSGFVISSALSGEIWLCKLRGTPFMSIVLS